MVPTKADIYNEWLWRLDAVVQPETRAVFRRLLEQGWIDATRHLHPEERIYTFWVNDAAFRRNAGFRVDFLLHAQPRDAVGRHRSRQRRARQRQGERSRARLGAAARTFPALAV